MNENETIQAAPFLGILFDERPEEVKQTQDVQFAEVVASVNPVQWREKPTAEIRKFPIFNQNGSGSCVAQTTAKLAGIMYWLDNGKTDYVHFSATHIYQRRSNKPAAGMAGENAFQIAAEGITLEELVPSQNMSDEQMDSVVIQKYKVDVGKIFKFGKPVEVPAGDIETVASVIQTTGKGVMVWFYWLIDEWTSIPVVKYPNLNLYAATTARHSVTAVDFTILGPSNVPNNPEVWGKKALVIDDSWGSSYGAAGQRFVTEDFFKARNWYSRHVQRFTFQEAQEDAPVTPSLKYYFSNKLEFIPWDAKKNQPQNMVLHEAQKKDVVALQNILKAEGFLAKNVDSTGYYGALTALAVLELQKKYLTVPLQDLLDLGGKSVGPKTLEFLNQKYN